MGDLLGATLERNEFGFSVILRFFETSHAKGEQDGEGGVQKSTALRDVLVEGLIIRNATEWVAYICEWTKTRPPDKNMTSRALTSQ
jgi:hypothetical protein